MKPLSLDKGLDFQRAEDAGRWLELSIGGEVYLRYMGTDEWRAKLDKAERLYRIKNRIRPNQEIPQQESERIYRDLVVGSILADWRGMVVSANRAGELAGHLDLGAQRNEGGVQVIEIPFSEKNARWFMHNYRDFRAEVVRLSASQEVFRDELLSAEADFSVGSSGGASGGNG